MARQDTTPYVCHVFVCTNDRHGEGKSCADAGGQDVRAVLKQAISERGWKDRVRVSQSGCLGVCAQGPNVMLYPQRIWFRGATAGVEQEILAAIEAILAGQ